MRLVGGLVGSAVLALVVTGGRSAAPTPGDDPAAQAPACATGESYEPAEDATGLPARREAALAHLEGTSAGRWRGLGEDALREAILDGTAIVEGPDHATPDERVRVTVSRVSVGYLVTEFVYPVLCD